MYQRIEAKIRIPKGPEGKSFVADRYPELALALQLIPKPSAPSA